MPFSVDFLTFCIKVIGQWRAVFLVCLVGVELLLFLNG